MSSSYTLFPNTDLACWDVIVKAKLWTHCTFPGQLAATPPLSRPHHQSVPTITHYSPLFYPLNLVKSSLNDNFVALTQSISDIQPMPRIPITKENARELTLRGIAKRRARVAELKRLQEERIQFLPIPARQIIEQSLSEIARERLELIREQIVIARLVLNSTDQHYCKHCERGDLDGKTRAQMIKALDTLLDRERILLGIPLPGQRRPQEDRVKRTVSVDYMPTPPTEVGLVVDDEPEPVVPVIDVETGPDALEPAIASLTQMASSGA